MKQLVLAFLAASIYSLCSCPEGATPRRASLSIKFEEWARRGDRIEVRRQLREHPLQASSVAVHGRLLIGLQPP
jgi:hypothetical protein